MIGGYVVVLSSQNIDEEISYKIFVDYFTHRTIAPSMFAIGSLVWRDSG